MLTENGHFTSTVFSKLVVHFILNDSGDGTRRIALGIAGCLEFAHPTVF
jgi:hypothetical protein